MQLPTYGFKSFIFSITGPGINLPNTQATSDEGVVITAQSDSGDTKVGLDGIPVISKREDRRLRITFNIYQNSPSIPLLQLGFNYQNTDPALYGANTIIIQDTTTGATYRLTNCRFMSQATIEIKQDVSAQVWEFESGDNLVIQ